MTVLGQDTFAGRTVATGFGTASDGQTWVQYSGGTVGSVASNEGSIINSGGPFYMTLGSKTPSDIEMLFRMAINNTGDQSGAIVRFTDGGNYYRFEYRFGVLALSKKVGGGSFTTIASATFNPTVSTFYWYRFKMIGTTYWGKAWQDGTAEPNTWMINSTDSSFASGQFGLFSTGSSAVNTQFDNLYVLDYSSINSGPVSDILANSGNNFLSEAKARVGYDTFAGKTVAGGFGTATDGQTWNFTISGPNLSTIVSVGSGEAQIGYDSSQSFYLATLGSTTFADQEVTCRIMENAANLSNARAGVVLRYKSSGTFYAVRLAGQQIQLIKRVGFTYSFPTMNGTISAPMTSGTFYWLKARIVQSTIIAKYWQDGTSEPSSWQCWYIDTDISGAGLFGIYGEQFSSGVYAQYDNFIASSITLTNTTNFSDSLNENGTQVYSDLLTPVDTLFDNRPALFSAQTSPTTDNLLQNDIFIDNLPITVGADDANNRTVVSGWGNASDGQAWINEYGTATASVGNGELQLSSPSSPTAYILGINDSGYTDVVMRFSPGATNDEIGITMRYQDNNNWYIFDSYHCTNLRIRSNVNRTYSQFTSPLFATVPGTFYWMRARMSDSSMFLRVWADGSSEPTTWNATATNTALQVGNFGIYGLPSTSTPIQYDSFLVTGWGGSNQMYPIDTYFVGSPSFFTDQLIPTMSKTVTDKFNPVDILRPSDSLYIYSTMKIVKKITFLGGNLMWVKSRQTPGLEIHLTREDGSVVDLTGTQNYDLSMTFYNVNTQTDFDGSGTFAILDAPNGILQYAWSSQDVGVAGIYRLYCNVWSIPFVTSHVNLIIEDM